MNTLSIGISIAITVCIFITQLIFYRRNVSSSKFMEMFFPSDEKGAFSIIEDEQGIRSIGVSGVEIEFSDATSLNSLINELNKYIKRNIGTTDFAIIQNKTERFTETIYEHSTSTSSMPTYIGLMGTFIGVLIGLAFFSTNIFGMSDEAKINGLIYGVMISMLTSLTGLIFTTMSNHSAARAKKLMDERKNSFYDFIQNELMPTLGTSVVESLAKLKDTINNFVPAFDTVIESFHDTFDECTQAFGNEFRSNVTVVTDAIRVMGENIGELNAVSSNLRSLLVELRTGQMTETLQRFIDSVHSIDELEENIIYLEQQKEFLNTSTQELMNAQAAYLLSLEVPQDIANKLKNILDRFVTFEDNINKFGEGLAQNQLLGNREINLVQQQIKALERNTQLITDFQELSTNELESVCNAQISDVQQLTRRYTSAINQHAEDFKDLMDSIANEIEIKKNMFMDTLQKAFTVADVETEFKHLNELPAVVARLGAIENALKEESDLVEKLEDIRLSTVDVFETIEKIRTENAIDDKLEETQRKIDASQNNYMQTLSQLRSQIESLKVDELANSNQSIISKINSLSRELDEINRSISKLPTDKIPVNEINGIREKIESVEKQLRNINNGERNNGWSFFGRR